MDQMKLGINYLTNTTKMFEFRVYFFLLLQQQSLQIYGIFMVNVLFDRF